MSRISKKERIILEEEFTKEVGLTLCVGNRKEYSEWLEYRLVKNLFIQRVINSGLNESNINPKLLDTLNDIESKIKR